MAANVVKSHILIFKTRFIAETFSVLSTAFLFGWGFSFLFWQFIVFPQIQFCVRYGSLYISDDADILNFFFEF